MYAYRAAAAGLLITMFDGGQLLTSDVAETTAFKGIGAMASSIEWLRRPLPRSRLVWHLLQSTEPRAVLGLKYVMAMPAQFVKLGERLVTGPARYAQGEQTSSLFGRCGYLLQMCWVVEGLQTVFLCVCVCVCVLRDTLA